MRQQERYKVFILASLFLAFFFGNSQTKQMSFSWEGIPLDSCIAEIEAENELNFYYAQDWVDSVVVTKSIQASSASELIEQLLSETGLSFFIQESAIILTKAPIITALAIDERVSENPTASFAREQINEKGLIIIGKRARGKESARVSGVVKDINGNPLVGALVYIQDLQLSGTTNQRGEYSLTVPVGRHEIQTQSVGFEPKFQEAQVNGDGKYDVEMEVQAEVLDEIYVFSNADRNVSSNITGLTKLNLEEAKTIPKVFGENDIVQVALALPGVQSVGEGAAGINVRGGKTDQNLVLFNDVTLYNPFHFFGFFSAFNSDIVGGTDLYKGSVPAEFGGRLSSILNVDMKRGNSEEFSGKLGISPVTSKLSANVPIIKDKLSLVAGGRATYSDWVINSVSNETIKNSDPSFFDVAASLNANLGEKHTLEAFGYYSKDDFKLTLDSAFSYFNFGTSLKWFYQIGENLSLNTTTALSEYSFNVENANLGAESFEYGFDIRDIYFKTMLNLDRPKNQYSLGFDAKLYELNPGFVKPLGPESLLEPETLETEKGREFSVFFSDNVAIMNNLTGSFGLRYSLFSALGPRSINRYESNSLRNDASLIETVDYTDGEVIETFSGPELRASLNYLVNDGLSIKANYTMMRQYIHSLSNTVSVSPLDTWKLSDTNFKPQLSKQYSVGVYKNLEGNSIELSAELYYKDFDNIVDYKVGADLVLNPILERDIIQGDGRARGMELLIRKKSGKLTGWIGYTYSRSEQRFVSEFVEETINRGEYFPSNFDKPHDFSLITNYKINRRFSTSLNVVFSSGRPVTYPTAKYTLSNREIVHFGDRNEFRIPNYFRVDLGINVEPSHRKNNLLYTYWSFSIYNLLGRNNAYSVFFRSDENGDIQGYQLSVLASPIPSLTYNIIF